MRLALFLFCTLLFSVMGHLHADNGPSLDDTIQYLTNNLNNMPSIRMDADGVIVSTNKVISFKDNYLLVKCALHLGNGTPLDLASTSTISLPLNKLDPSVIVTEHHNGKVTYYCISLKTPTRANDINVQLNYVDRTHPQNNKTSSSSVNGAVLYIGDKSTADGIANAFRHAIELCGGKIDPFATPSQ